jgi:uncharacterized protein
MQKAALSDLAIAGALFTVKAVPRAKQNAVSFDGKVFQIRTTAPADEGRANAAVTEALAHVLGVAKTRLTLQRGATACDKLFRLD